MTPTTLPEHPSRPSRARAHPGDPLADPVRPPGARTREHSRPARPLHRRRGAPARGPRAARVRRQRAGRRPRRHHARRSAARGAPRRRRARRERGLVCRDYLRDPRGRRCRPVTPEDLLAAPFSEGGEREDPELGSAPPPETVELLDRHGWVATGWRRSTPACRSRSCAGAGWRVGSELGESALIGRRSELGRRPSACATSWGAWKATSPSAPSPRRRWRSTARTPRSPSRCCAPSCSASMRAASSSTGDLRRAVLVAIAHPGAQPERDRLPLRAGQARRQGQRQRRDQLARPPCRHLARERWRRADARGSTAKCSPDRAPRTRREPPRGRALSSAAVETLRSRRRSLVVEHDPEVGRPLVEQLVADGYRARLARTAEHARVLARTLRPSVALLGDLESPHAALELLAEIRGGGSAAPAGAERPWPAEPARDRGRLPARRSPTCCGPLRPAPTTSSRAPPVTWSCGHACAPCFSERPRAARRAAASSALRWGRWRSTPALTS